jgi:hypothetical protein
MFTEINTEIELNYLFEKGMTFEELEEAVFQYIGEQEIICYNKAIKFLTDNDPSLKDSLSLAADMGFAPENLNSELLATLLHQNLLIEEWAEIAEQVKEALEDIENE